MTINVKNVMRDGAPNIMKNGADTTKSASYGIANLTALGARVMVGYGVNGLLSGANGASRRLTDMQCFSIGLIEQILVFLVIIGAVWSLISLLLPLVIGPLGAFGSVVIQALKIILWAIVAIFIIYFVFDLIACLLPGGFHLPQR